MTDLFEPIRVDGLNALRKSLKDAGEGAEKEIRPALNDAAQIVVNVAQRRIPVLTGAARKSVRVSSTGNKVRVSAGGTRAPYYPWLDYGGRTGIRGSVVRPFDKGGRYLYPAYGQERANIMRVLEKRIVAIIEAKGLGVT